MAADEAYLVPPMTYRRILFVLMGSIGDVVRALPLLGRVRRAFPSAHIAWAVEPKSEGILRNHPWLDELIVYDRRRAPWSFLPFLAAIRSRRFDLVLDAQRHLKSGLVTWVSGASVRVGFSRENAKEFNYWFSTLKAAPQPPMKLKLLQYQALGDALGLPPSPIEFGLVPREEERAAIRQLMPQGDGPWVAAILGSSWPSRLYFPDFTAAVLKDLAAGKDETPPFRAALVGGREDVVIAREVVAHSGGLRLLDLTGKTALNELPALFSECAVAFGPDCGPMHIAAAVGCPVVSLWGATAPERSAPWGFSELALRGEIPCHPCYLRRCPIGRECMRRIEPGEVARAIRRAWRLRKESDGVVAGTTTNCVGV